MNKVNILRKKTLLPPHHGLDPGQVGRLSHADVEARELLETAAVALGHHPHQVVTPLPLPHQRTPGITLRADLLSSELSPAKVIPKLLDELK